MTFGKHYEILIREDLSLALKFFNMEKINKTASAGLELKKVVENFISASDQGDLGAIINFYASGFLNVRVTDQGEVIRIDKDQMVHLLSNWNGPHVETKSTSIEHVEVLGNMGFALLVRIKNLGNGWAPMFYNLVWTRENGKWLFLREFVFQKSFSRSAKDS